ncbi:MAG: electron transfer flavoprotein subunit beta/FixA family protein [Elusimicrobiota bacterium]
MKSNGKKENLRIIVCMKVVPRPEEVVVDPKTHTLDRAKARSLINPPDLNALEMALALKDANGGEVTLVSMGPPFVEPYLRLAMAVGADRAFLLSDRAFGAADTLATTYTLAKGIEKIGAFDIILCGEESSDGATAQVPPGLAEWLDAAQVMYAVKMEKVPGKPQLKVRREVKGGVEDLIVNLPAVASVKSNVNEPRFIDFDRRPWATEETPVTVWNSKDLGTKADLIGLTGSPSRVDSVRQVSTRERQKKAMKGTPEEIAKELAQIIRAQLRTR